MRDLVTVHSKSTAGRHRAPFFEQPLDPARFDVQAEQRHASAAGTLPAQVAEELE